MLALDSSPMEDDVFSMLNSRPLSFPNMYRVVALQVPVSKPHPCSRAQCSHLWVPVTPAAIVDLWFFYFLLLDGQRLAAKAEFCRCYWGGKRRTTKVENVNFGEVLSCSHSTDGQPTDQWTGQMNVCTDETRRKSQFCSLAGACDVRTSSRDWVISNTQFITCFNVWF